jgi:addiction module HigA family antidote
MLITCGRLRLKVHREDIVSSPDATEPALDSLNGRLVQGKKLDPIHPGEILAEEFLGPLEISHYRLAKDVSVPPRRIKGIVQGKRGISADSALRLARYFATSERFWINLQSHYDLDFRRTSSVHGSREKLRT